MHLLEIDWKAILLGDEQWDFLLETMFRTLVMFLVIVLSLRLLGKRGVKQLSVFELGVIIGLGSAAGDPMFYKDVGLLPGILVFTIVISAYRFITFLINRNDRFEAFVEGTPTCVILDGKLQLRDFEKEPIARDELFSELRLKSVSHLGQVQQAIIETNGDVSIYYFSDDDVRYGLPIIPGQSETKYTVTGGEGYYSCHDCGYTEKLLPNTEKHCPECRKKIWIQSINSRRIR